MLHCIYAAWYTTYQYGEASLIARGPKYEVYVMNLIVLCIDYCKYILASCVWDQEDVASVATT